LVMGKAP